MKLNLPTYDYLLQKKNEVLYIYDLVRKKYVVLTPEEWVRQHFLNYLLTEISVPHSMISTETSLKYNRLSKRADIVVFGNTGIPVLLIECKAPTVNLTKDTLMQLSLYNKNLTVPYIGITNGMKHNFWKWNVAGNKYILSGLPEKYSFFNEL